MYNYFIMTAALFSDDEPIVTREVIMPCVGHSLEPENTDNIMSPSPGATDISPLPEATNNISLSLKTNDNIIPPLAETTDMPPSPTSPSAPIISDTESTYTADDDVSCFSLSFVSGMVVNTSLCIIIIIILLFQTSINCRPRRR